MMYDIFDAHCDTMYELISNFQDENIIKNKLHFNLLNIEKYNSYIQVLALWANPQYQGAEAEIYIKSILRKTLSHLDEYDIKPIETAADLLDTRRFGAIIGIEGADAVKKEEDLVYYYNNKVRIMTLTWNGENLIGSGALSGREEGLTPFGKEIIKKMNNLGMAVDLSHLNEPGFYDVMDISDAPVIVSHSNSYTVCNHKRNLKDGQFKELIKNGGVLGINFCPDFLKENGEAGILDIISHIEHFCSLGGEKHIGFGSDFDGVTKLPCGITSNKDMDLIANELLKLNYKEEQIKDITFRNFQRIFLEILG